jgi:hypothetical protein
MLTFLFGLFGWFSLLDVCRDEIFDVIGNNLNQTVVMKTRVQTDGQCDQISQEQIVDAGSDPCQDAGAQCDGHQILETIMELK